MSVLLHFLYEQLFVTPHYPKHGVQDQTIIVTGSNVGLGLEAARHFARMGAEKVILAVRSIEKGEAAKKLIESSTNRSDVVEVWHLDLSSYASVKDFAKRADSLRRLDAIIENAGIVTQNFRMMEENEATITTNVVSTFLLAVMILPKLRETAARYNVTPRLSIVSSEVHFFTDFPERNEQDLFQALSDKEKARMMDRYNVSKMLEVLYTRELANKAKESGKTQVIINYLNPGLCHSELARESGGLGFSILKALLARSTEAGSRTLVHAATEAGIESYGQYLSSNRVSKPAPLVTSPEGIRAQEKVWVQLSKKLEEIQPGIMQNI